MYLIIGSLHSVFKKHFDEHKITYYIIKDEKRHYVFEDGGHLIDFDDQAAVLAAVDALPERPSCVWTMYERYIALTADINRHLGLTHALSPEAARASTDKILMREAFARAPEPISPPFAAVSSEADVRAFATAHGFPVILKPANLSKSLLITRCDTMEALVAAWQHASAQAAELYAHYTDGLQPRFILESFMPGSVHTALGYADKDGTVVLADALVDNITAQEAGFDDSFIYSRAMPSLLSAAQQQALLHCAEQGMRALGLRSCAAHIELILTKDGPRIIEIGARLGGYRTTMYSMVNGINIVGATIAAYSGELPDLTPTRHAHYRAIEIFPTERGSLVEITQFTAASQLPSISAARLKAQLGDTVGKASQGFKAVAIFELYSDSADQIAQDYDYIRTHVTAVTA
ncbi:MAG TPA: ATP-grasp domain-containing protein [Candidatus Saccharimonadales bacterium]|nr:ATP-grasp domain-containing protein [Candidatus Saccharimonadales bacterium]